MPCILFLYSSLGDACFDKNRSLGFCLKNRKARSLWDFGEFLHIYAKIPIIGAPLGV
jgi:hypothetical protein